MSSSRARGRALQLLVTVAALSAGAACTDKSRTGAASPQSAGGDVAGDTARGAASQSAVVLPHADSVALPSAELPKRSRRDSVALASMTKGDKYDSLWPVKMPTPRAGAVLPNHRIIAYYGNPLSKKMGVLGEYPKDEMLAMLDREAARWAKADPSRPVKKALHLIVTVAQGAPGKNGLHRLQMRDSMVNEVYSWAKSKNAIFFMDIQVGLSDVQSEVPRLRPFLENPDVHLALDPEFAMKPSGKKPGTKIGTLDAADINWAINFLDQIVREKNLPPKILVVHRFTRKMVTNADKIRPTPNVQVVMDMDGWGPPWLKFDSYHDYVKAEPVQFTGFKLFYHNDTKKGDPLMQPKDLLALWPQPVYIQYQ